MSLIDSYKRLTVKRSTWTGLLLVFVAALTLEATSLIQVFSSQKALAEEASKRANIQLESSRNQIMDVIDQAEAAVRNGIWITQWCLDYQDSLPRVCWRMVNDNPVLVGSSVSLVPGYSPRHPLYAPYVFRDGDSLVSRSLATQEYDYPSQEWFVKPIENDCAYWSEPYIDFGGGEVLMTTYSVPVKDQQGTTGAVLTGDISLGWLSSTIGDLPIYPHATNLMISREGRVMVSPSKGVAMNKTVQELAEEIKNNTDYKELNRAMLAGETGSIKMLYRGIKSQAYYAPIDRLGWSMCIVIPEDDIFGGIRRINLLVKLLQLLGLAMLIMILRSLVKSQIKYRNLDERKERMERELQIARNIQMAMVPKGNPPFPDRHDLDISADIVPAKEVGGDLYDYYIRDGKLFFCIGDVSGKGIPASLVMAVTRSVFRTLSSKEESPAKIVTAMNDSMTEVNDSVMFVTLFCGALDLTNGHLRFCNAGHNPPFILTDSIQALPVEANLPLGIVPSMVFKEQEYTLAKDDALFLYTDGLSEAENKEHEQFGEDRMMSALSGRKSAEEHLENIKRKVGEFVGNAPQSDDLTMLFLHYLGAEPAPRITLENDIRQLERLPEWLETITSGTGLDDLTMTNINLALEEAVTNVMLYAYPEGVTGQVELEALRKDGRLEFVLSDSGKPFDPTAAPKADTTASLADRPIGGLGIHLVRTIMDSVRYERKDGKNYLYMSKNI